MRSPTIQPIRLLKSEGSRESDEERPFFTGIAKQQNIAKWQREAAEPATQKVKVAAVSFRCGTRFGWVPYRIRPFVLFLVEVVAHLRGIDQKLCVRRLLAYQIGLVSFNFSFPEHIFGKIEKTTPITYILSARQPV